MDKERIMLKEELERLDDVGIGSWDSHKPEVFADLFADDFVLEDITVPAPIRTKEGAEAYVQSWLTAFPDIHVRRTNRVIGEDSIAGELEFTGTNLGPLAMGDMTLPPTSKTVVGRGAYFVRVRDGKIVEFHSHPDAAGMMVQLGLMPQS
jgi:predicted ester cyclase